MKHKNSIVTISLNILFCAALLWFFSRNAFLRPYLGSTAKEFLSGLLLLVTLYANYFVFYPKLRRGHTLVYWLSVVATSLMAGCVELALGYQFISKCQAVIIAKVGPLHYFSKHLFLLFGRDLAFNLFPYLLRERKQLQQSLETEVRVVYQYARVIDVCDGDNNCQHIPIDDIFYCKKNGNETDVYTVGGVKYTRYCSIKYLVQLFGNEDFIRISPSYLVPFQHIASCDGEDVVMKTMSWMESPLAFKLDSKRYRSSAAIIDEYLRANLEDTDVEQPDSEEGKGKRLPSVPPKDKLDAVLGYIQEHPGCRSTEIIAHTSYPKTTMERCLSCLRIQGFIEYSGSKKTGGYHLVNTMQEENAAEPVQKERDVIEEKNTEEKSAKKKLNKEKTAEPSSKE